MYCTRMLTIILAFLLLSFVVINVFWFCSPFQITSSGFKFRNLTWEEEKLPAFVTGFSDNHMKEGLYFLDDVVRTFGNITEPVLVFYDLGLGKNCTADLKEKYGQRSLGVWWMDSSLTLLKDFPQVYSKSGSLDQKRQWTDEIKRLMLEHYNVEIPNRAKQIVMTLATPKVDKRQMSSLRPNSAGKRGNPVPKYLEKRRKSADASAKLRILRNTSRSASTTDLVQADSFETPIHTLAPKEKTGRIEDFFEQRRQSAEQKPINSVNRFHLLRLRKNKRQNSIENNNEMKRRYFESNELPSTLPCGPDTKESTVDDKRATSSSGDSAYESNGNHKDFTQEMCQKNLDFPYINWRHLRDGPWKKLKRQSLEKQRMFPDDLDQMERKSDTSVDHAYTISSRSAIDL